MRLILVESPTKSKTISKFLGPEYKILASYGHIRDLPKSKLGIDIENDFAPQYIIPQKSKKILRGIREEAEKSESLILACDPDREGEAISWHLVEALGLKNLTHQRIVFHELTKSAIEEALKNPKEINFNLVESQQGRRILDRIVGYKLSPFLWKKLFRGLSAGRVQSVALKLVCAREEEIKNFIAQEYWTIAATFLKTKNQIPNTKNNEFDAFLIKKDDKIISRLEIKTKEETEKIIKDLEGAEFKVIEIEKKEIKKNPLPPFITSVLQQEAWKKFHFPAKFTMSIAQQLFEKGFISYHRTDSLNISSLALNSIKSFIIKNFGENFYQFRIFKTKSKLAQEAHEAIRPTYIENLPEKLVKEKKIDEKQFKLYHLIWSRTLASQMSPGIFDLTRIDIRGSFKSAESEIKSYTFRTTGQILKFEGFLKIYPINIEEKQLPDVGKDENLMLLKISPAQHFTEPPSRYSEATLIKALEENDIGRPSTYATILSTIQERNYVEKDENRRLKPTEIGTMVNDILTKHFPDIVDVNFTAKMENELDAIAQGKLGRIKMLKDFYGPFEENLKKKEKEVATKKIIKETEKICPECGSRLVIRMGRYGEFYACSGFPKCRHTEPLEKNDTGIICPKCQKGKILKKRTKKGKFFYSCSKWPSCDFALWDKPLDEKCPQCNSLLIESKKGIIKCSNKNCDYKKAEEK